jgi:dihydroceramidase
MEIMMENLEHGFWGPTTATADWCEINYDTTPYVAEFWNTVSSFVISLAGLI